MGLGSGENLGKSIKGGTGGGRQTMYSCDLVLVPALEASWYYPVTV